VAIDHRGNEQRASEFRHWGTWLGGVWSEDAEGTNGIGTCIAEARPVTVHQTQHFRTRHTPLSCSGAPVFDAEARLIAVIDVSSINPDLSARAHALTLPLVTMSARLIEERLFRERFRKAWIFALASYEDQPASLLALEQDHRLVGADRHARTRFYIDQQSIDAGITLWSMFARKVSPIQNGARSDYPVRLTTCGGDSVFALVSPPLSTSRLHIGRFDATLLLRPRMELLEDLSRRFESTPPRGGLAPGMLRRVTEHIDSHLSDALPIAILAAHAGLSTYHFARAFKKSVGIPPHRYVLQQRIKKSAELLKQTALPLIAIAQLAGFTDQSHFSRSFRCHLGRSPSDYRRSHR
jgi:AraC-like DNA-binding protein